MERFAGEQLPFSVAVIDMDWHLVDIDPEYGSGWTGYTWNRELFPDPSRFLQWLHDRGMRVTLNVHPADGVRAFEEPLPEMAQALGIDPETKTAIPFDPGSRKFMDAYLTKRLIPWSGRVWISGGSTGSREQTAGWKGLIRCGC